MIPTPIRYRCRDTLVTKILLEYACLIIYDWSQRVNVNILTEFYDHKPWLVNSIGVIILREHSGYSALYNYSFMLQARPLFKDRRKFAQMADPLLQGQYPVRGLYQALAVAAMCVQEQPNMRPLIADVVTALTYLASQKYDPESQPAHNLRTGSSTPRTRRKL